MKALFASLSLLMLASCVTYRLQPVENKAADQGDLGVRASAVWAPELSFTVQVTNRSNRELTINSDQFRLYSGDNGVWTELPMTTSAEVYRRAEADYRYQPSIIFSDGPVYRSTTTTTVIGGGGSLTIVRTQPVPEPTRTVTVIAAPDQRRLEWLKKSLFYSVVLQPGLDFTGVVYGSMGKGSRYKLVIPVDGKNYEVQFERVKQRLLPFTNLD